MSDEYPLYSKLTEEGKQQAQIILGAVKPQLLKVAEEVFDKFYFDVIPCTESVYTPEYNPDISLHDTDISLSSPPDMPKEYYDSMVVEYFNGQEKLYDFFTPTD